MVQHSRTCLRRPPFWAKPSDHSRDGGRPYEFTHRTNHVINCDVTLLLVCPDLVLDDLLPCVIVCFGVDFCHGFSKVFVPKEGQVTTLSLSEWLWVNIWSGSRSPKQYLNKIYLWGKGGPHKTGFTVYETLIYR